MRQDWGVCLPAQHLDCLCVSPRLAGLVMKRSRPVVVRRQCEKLPGYRIGLLWGDRWDEVTDRCRAERQVPEEGLGLFNQEFAVGVVTAGMEVADPIR